MAGCVYSVEDCDFFTYIRNKYGYKTAKIAYAIATDETIIADNATKNHYKTVKIKTTDSDGKEIEQDTGYPLMRDTPNGPILTEHAENFLKQYGSILGISSDSIINSLMKSLGSQPLDFLQAVRKVVAFNNELNGAQANALLKHNANFYAYMADYANGKVMIKFTLSQAEAVAANNEFISKRFLYERLLYQFAELGFAVNEIAEGLDSKLLANREFQTTSEGLSVLAELAVGYDPEHPGRPYPTNLQHALRDASMAELCGYLLLIVGNSHKELKEPINRLKEVLTRDGVADKFIKKYNENIKKLRQEGNETTEVSFEASRSTNLENWLKVGAYIIGKMLLNRVGYNRNYKPSKFQSFSNTISSLVRKLLIKFFNLFDNFDWAKYARDKRIAEDVAEQVSLGFMDGNFKNGFDEETLKSLDNKFTEITKIALLTNRTKLALNKNMETFKRVFETVLNSLKEIKKGNHRSANYLEEKLTEAELMTDMANYGGPNDVMSHNKANRAILKVLASLLSEYESFRENIMKIDFSKEADFSLNMGKYASKILAALAYIDAITDVCDCLKLATSEQEAMTGEFSFVGFSEILETNAFGITRKIDMRDSINQLKILADSAKNNMAALKRSFAVRFMQEAVGSYQIHRGDRVILDGIFKTKVEGQLNYTMDDLLTYIDEDLGIFNSVFRSMADNPDVVGQVFDKVVKVAKHKANLAFINTRDKLYDLWNLALADNVNLEDLYDYTIEGVDKKGKPKKIPNGYIIQKEDWFTWRENFELFKEEKKKEFILTYGAYELSKMSEITVSALWSKFFHEYYKAWHEKNSQTVVLETDRNGKPIKTKTIPNTIEGAGKNVYINQKWNNPDNPLSLTDKQRDYAMKYMQIKESLDAMLPKGSTDTARLPQMIANSFYNEMLNRRRSGDNKWFVAPFKTICRRVFDNFVRTANDTDFGSDLTINNDSDIVFNTEIYKQLNLRRVPLFYINRLKKEDRVRLSTDLIGSTMAYAAMACQYHQLNTIETSLNILLDLLKDRKIKKYDDEKNPKNYKHPERANKRISNFMDKEVYGITSTIGAWLTSLKNNVVVKKTIQLLTSLASRYMLGGNVHGALANTIMGMTEVMKEGWVGEYYNLTDTRRALAIYFGMGKELHNGNLLMDYFLQIKESKVNMWAERFDLFGEAQRTFREYDFRDPKLDSIMKGEIFFKNCLAPYSTGDHLMQVIPFLAMALNLKLYYKNDRGEVVESNIYDAYYVGKSTRDGRDTGANKKGELILRKCVKNKEDFRLLELAEKLKNRLEQFIEERKTKADAVFDFSEFSDELLTLIFNYGFYSEAYQDGSRLYLFVQNFKNNVNNKNSTTALDALKLVTQHANSLVWNDYDEAMFKNKARTVCNRLHGIYNSQDKTEFSRNVLGASLASMKGYAFGMIERRYGSIHYSLALGLDVEGSMLSTYKALIASVRSKNFLKFMYMQFNPVYAHAVAEGDSDVSFLRNLGFSRNLRYNTLRHCSDLFTGLLLTLAVGGMLTSFGYFGLIGAKLQNDDDKFSTEYYGGDWWWACAYYFLTRLYAEQGAFNDPLTYKNVEHGSLFSLIPVPVDFLCSIGQIITLGDEKFVDDLKHDTQYKAWDKILKMLPYWRTYYTLRKNPRSAALSYLNRNTRR